MRLLLPVAALALCLPATAQDWQVPADVKLEKAEDYPKHDKDILACIGWLERTPQNTRTEERNKANAFLLMWLTGAPHVTIEVNTDVLPFMKNEGNAQFLLTFMGGWTRYALTDADGGKDILKGNLAGLRSVVHVYDKVGGAQKDKELDKLVKLEKDGKLEAWVRKQLKL